MANYLEEVCCHFSMTALPLVRHEVAYVSGHIFKGLHDASARCLTADKMETGVLLAKKNCQLVRIA